MGQPNSITYRRRDHFDGQLYLGQMAEIPFDRLLFLIELYLSFFHLIFGFLFSLKPRFSVQKPLVFLPDGPFESS